MPNSRHTDTRHYRKYSDKDIINLVPKVTSMRQLLLAVGLKPVGGNYANMKRILEQLKKDVDTEHWTGQACRVGQQKDWSDYTKASSLKPYIIEERGYKCEICFVSDWLGEKLVLELDHIDGNRTNNIKNNLRLLCPNCHSQTPTWRNRKI